MDTRFTFSSFRRPAQHLLGRVRTLLALTALGSLALPAQAQMPLTGTATTVDFNELGTTAAGVVPAGFTFSAEAAPTYTSANNYTAFTQAANGNNFTAGGTYNFGAAAASADRAIGFLASGSYTAPRHVLLAVQNTSGTTIQDLAVEFAVEKYRTNTRVFEWQFFVSTDGVTWEPQPAATEGLPAGANTYHYPPVSATKQVTLAGLNLAANATYYLRWTYLGVGGTTNAQGIGLDDVVLTPTLAGGTTPTPTATITTTPSAYAGSYCLTTSASSAAFEVPFTATGTFSGLFKAQLSDANGVFPANTTANIIGTGTSSPISAALPAGTPSGTGYRIRVVNDAPATLGNNNGTDLTVTLAPATNAVAVTPAGSQTLATTGTGNLLTATAAAPSTFSWEYGTSPAGPFTPLADATASSYRVSGTDFLGAGTYYIVASATADCGNVTGRSTPITITLTAPQPELAISTATLADFGSVVAGGSSVVKSFTVSGNGLTAPILLTPPAGVEIRTGSNPFACCTISLAPTGGTVGSTTIEVRFAPMAAQAYQTAIPVTSTGQPAQAVTVSGTGTAPVYPATLSTTAVSAVATTSATTGGTIANDGGSPVTARGIVWGTETNPTLGTNRTVDSTSANSFTSVLTDLLPGTTYYVRAYATTAVSTAYGEEFTFTTATVALAVEPTVQPTLTATQVTSTSIQLHLSGGNGAKRLVLVRQGSAVNALPVDATTYTANAAFGQGSQLGTGNYVVYSGSTDSVVVTGLRPATAYTFAVVAFNDNNIPFAENYLTTAPGTLEQTTPAAPAQLLLVENFEYTAGTLLTDNNWTAHSGAGSRALTVVTPSLSYSGYDASNIGNATALTGSGEDVNRPFAPVYARTPVYASFLVNVSSATTTGDYFLHLGPANLGSTFRPRVFVRRSGTGKLQFGISGGGAPTYAATEYELNTTYQLVVKYVFDESGNVSQLFINPDAAAEPATATISVSEAGTSSPSDIGTLALRQGSSSPALVIDGIRVGTTYRTVQTGITCETPQPAFTATTACTGTATAFTNTSTVVEGNAAFAWDVDGDGKTDYTTKGAFTHTYAAAGTYQATLTITQGTCANTYTQAVTVNASPVVTVPTLAPATAAYGQTGTSVAFAATATGSPAPVLTYSIVQNGTVTTITSPYTFPVGTTTVTATATNSCATVSQPFTVTVQATAASLSVLHQDADRQLTNNMIKPYLQLRNESSAAIPYQQLTVRYWLTAEDYATLQGAVDYAQLGTNNVQLRYVPLTEPRQGAFGYMEYSFSAAAGNLAAGANSGPIQARFYKQNWTNFNEADDYSYASNSAYTKNARITVYRNGLLVGGVEPAPVAASRNLRVYVQNTSSSTTSNTISTTLQLRNEGNTPAAYQDLTVRYWLSPEGTAALLSAVDYAQLGNNNVQIVTGRSGTQTYAELRFSAALGTFGPLSSTGNIQYRLYKQDWSAFQHTNDYSYQAKGKDLLENARVTVYLQGQLVYGTEPAGTLAASATSTALTLHDEASTSAAVALRSYPNPFSDQTQLTFTLDQDQAYTLAIYDVSGRLVQQLPTGTATAGQPVHVTWQPAGLPAGVYLARLITASGVQQVKLVLR